MVVGNDGVREGPYVEGYELVAGYLICKAEGMAETVAFGKSCPILKYPHCSVEVRAILPFEP